MEVTAYNHDLLILRKRKHIHVVSLHFKKQVLDHLPLSSLLLQEELSVSTTHINSISISLLWREKLLYTEEALINALS